MTNVPRKNNNQQDEGDNADEDAEVGGGDN